MRDDGLVPAGIDDPLEHSGDSIDFSGKSVRRYRSSISIDYVSCHRLRIIDHPESVIG